MTLEYIIPCGQTVGHGESCSEGYLCAGCAEVERLRAQLGAQKGHYIRTDALLAVIAQLGVETQETKNNPLTRRRHRYVCEGALAVLEILTKHLTDNPGEEFDDGRKSTSTD
jgi:hypothetical protein